MLWGLSLAAQSGVQIREDVASRAASSLDVNLVNEETNPDRQAWLLHALSTHLGWSEAAPAHEQAQMAGSGAAFVD